MHFLPSPLRIAIVGSGAVGCYYGARLAQGGHDVHFLLRNDLDFVRKNGLKIRSYLGDFSLPLVQAYATTAAIGPCDLVIVALKTTANSALAELIPPLLGPHTLLLTLQNGLGNEEALASLASAEQVLGGICFTCINRTAPGVIEHTAQGQIVLGEFVGSDQPRTQALAAAMQASGIEASVTPNLLWTRWKKLVWNIPFNGLAIVGGGISTDRIMASPALLETVAALMHEVIAAASAHGLVMEPNLCQTMIDSTYEIGAYRPSSMIDFREGRPVEWNAIWAEPLRRAQALSVACPRLEQLTQLLQFLISERDRNRT
jgi:2-dehydropantoate 2-reductase